jgi:aldose 1-epimerase
VGPSGRQFRICAGEHAATVVEVGGAIREYAVGGRAVLEPWSADELMPAYAGAVLVPWPNRIAAGRYRFETDDLQLPVSEPATGSALHGLTCWLPWQCVGRTAEAVTLACTLHPSPGYPWRLDLAVRWRVGPDGLRAEHRAVNASGRRAPYGLGAHPYLRPPGTDGGALVDGIRLRLPDADGPVDFTAAREIGDTRLDSTFRRRDRDAPATLTTDRGTVEVWADATFGWWQVYDSHQPGGPAGRRGALAVEPMTCPPGAFATGEDLIVLRPGEEHVATWGCRATFA